MWFRPPKTPPDWSIAEAHLSGADPVLARLIEHVGPCLLAPRRDHFIALCQAVFTQQVSTAVATVLFARFRKLFADGRPTPAGVLAADDDQLRSAGLSRQKLSYLRDLATAFEDGRIRPQGLRRMSDEQVIEQLTAVRGIGRWTAEMFLIFSLNRPDHLPVADLGIRKAIQLGWGLAGMPDAGEIEAIGRPWRPWRTIATWYLWRGGSVLSAGRQP